jgi:hypothetical protein
MQITAMTYKRFYNIIFYQSEITVLEKKLKFRYQLFNISVHSLTGFSSSNNFLLQFEDCLINNISKRVAAMFVQ